MGRQIRIVRDIPSDATVAATGPGLHDLVLNLLFNASDALTSGGKITVVTQSIENGARLTICDDGIGMNEEVKRRVFEPFFTTQADVGRGLGLSSVYGQVARWNGQIEVTSDPGKGSSFVVDLPIWGDEVPEASTLPRSTRAGRVLVVEDEEVIRDVVKRVLGRRHEVQTEDDGPSAISALESRPFDVVLIDLGMPGMPGDELAMKIRNTHPEIVTVLMTGWGLSNRDPRTASFDLRIQKPFESMAALLQVVEQAIGIRDERGPYLP